MLRPPCCTESFVTSVDLPSRRRTLDILPDPFTSEQFQKLKRVMLRVEHGLGMVMI